MPFRLPHIRRTAVLIILLLSGISASAQYDAQTSQYMLAPGTFNPAVAGEGNDLLLTLQNRQQWVGIDGAPTTLLVNVSSPWVLKRNPSACSAPKCYSFNMLIKSNLSLAS